MGKFRGIWPDFIAPVKPNFVLSDTISISNWDNTVSIRTKNLPLAEDVFTSSTSSYDKNKKIFIFSIVSPIIKNLYFISKITYSSQQIALKLIVVANWIIL